MVAKTISFLAEPLIGLSKLPVSKQTPEQARAAYEPMLKQAQSLPEKVNAFVVHFIKKLGFDEKQITLCQMAGANKPIASYGCLAQWKFAIIVFSERTIKGMSECLQKENAVPASSLFLLSRELGYLKYGKHLEFKNATAKKQGAASLCSYLGTAAVLASAAFYFFSPQIAYPLCAGAHIVSCAVARYARNYFKREDSHFFEALIDTYAGGQSKEIAQGGMLLLEAERQRNLIIRNNFIEACRRISELFPNSKTTPNPNQISATIDKNGSNPNDDELPTLFSRVTFLGILYNEHIRKNLHHYPYNQRG